MIMKKVILAIAVLLISIPSFAQPKSIGLRAGYGMELSYQQNFSKKHFGNQFMEVDFGVDAGNKHGLRLAATYDFSVFRKDLTPGAFSLYLGPGLAGSMYGPTQFAFGFAFQFGAQFGFKSIPLDVTVDTRPVFWFGNNNDWASFIPMVGLRWRFAR